MHSSEDNSTAKEQSVGKKQSKCTINANSKIHTTGRVKRVYAAVSSYKCITACAADH